MERKITVGRDPSRDIHVSEAYDGVSRHHANIYYNNGRVIFEDISTNGSYVNNNSVHRTKIEVFPNDVITLGRHFVLPWSMIDKALSLSSQKATELQSPAYSPPYGNNIPPQAPPPPVQPGYNYGAGTIERELNSWNWGAFFFGWLWGIFNGVYWPLVVLIPYIGWAAALIINIVLGIKGNVWAWKGKYWRDFDHFKKVQKAWAMWALYIFIASIVLTILSAILFSSIIAAALWN
ncbi:MAG: FHA domain-containing protein [Tannerella sp.]|jgi:hypothetical protein|nr:FHA domain-containing protein [Tannerella sp.]